MTSVLLSSLVVPFMLSVAVAAPTITVMPYPASVDEHSGECSVDGAFRMGFGAPPGTLVRGACERFLHRLQVRTGLTFSQGIATDSLTLLITCEGPEPAVQSAVEDEFYQLDVDSSRARLSARSPYGILRGLETVLGLVGPGPRGFRIPAVSIRDSARFPWRGLLIDACRHWMAPDVIMRNLDAMAAVKMNVLHWHLSEDQGFRVESKVFPRLHGMGSDGLYYTQDQIRSIVAYAAARGIRVVPEFDMPGHTTSWFVGYPELASMPGPYVIERRWGVFDPTMDPTREELYTFLDAFVGEMTTLFPDAFFHIGGDEVNGRQWEASPSIQTFRTDHGMRDNHDLQVYFNKRLSAILTKHRRIMVGWDEILHPDLPRTIVVQSWRGQSSLAEAVREGSRAILSSGYYLDHMLPASALYMVDPLGREAAGLPPPLTKNVLGGEACMWAEFVNRETVDSRLWPRAAAVAERLWSPSTLQDTTDMYVRLGVLSRTLAWEGLTHRSGYEPMLNRLTGGLDTGPLRTLCDVLEPVRYYERPKSRPYTSMTPLNRLVDAARPESEAARIFGNTVDFFLAHRNDEPTVLSLKHHLDSWAENDSLLAPSLGANVLLAEAIPLSRDLAEIARIGRAALELLAAGTSPRQDVRNGMMQELLALSHPTAELTQAVLPHVVRLVRALE